jgi:hypothetical protein
MTIFTTNFYDYVGMNEGCMRVIYLLWRAARFSVSGLCLGTYSIDFGVMRLHGVISVLELKRSYIDVTYFEDKETYELSILSNLRENESSEMEHLRKKFHSLLKNIDFGFKERWNK